MNLIEQFPDISEEIRAKTNMGQRDYKSANATQPRSYRENDAVTKYFAGEFRRWHLKLFFILAVSVSILYFTLLQSSLILHWIII